MELPCRAFLLSMEDGYIALNIDKIYEDKTARAIGIGREFTGTLEARVGCCAVREDALEACVSSLVRFRDMLEKMLAGGESAAEYKSYYDERLSLSVSFCPDGSVQLKGRFAIDWNGNELHFCRRTTKDALGETLKTLNLCFTALNE